MMQKVNPGNKEITAISFFFDNQHSSNDYNVYFEVYATDDNPASANPSVKFASSSPVVTSSTIVLPKQTNSAIEFKIPVDGSLLDANTDYYVYIRTNHPSNPSWTGGQGLTKYSDGSTTGGAGNNWGKLNHKIYGRDP